MEDAAEECTAYCFSYPKARSYGPKIPALLSVIGSYIVIREVLANHNLRERSSTIPRFLLAMSISDMFFSVPYIFTTWAMPPHENLFQSSGSIATCTIQGASLQLGVSTSPLLNVAISFTALLMIRYQWRTARIVVVETLLQVLIWSYGLLATIPFIVWGMYNPTSTACWIASYPHHCGVKETDAIECIRGEGVEFWRAFFAFFPTWPCIVVGLTNMVLIYWTVRKMETRNIRWARRHSMVHHQSQMPDATTAAPSSMREFGPVVPSSLAATPDASAGPRLGLRRDDSQSRRKSRAVAIQAIFYTCAFLLTFSLDTIVLLWNVFTLKASHLLIVFAYILFPMQGCFNCIVYVRTADLQTPEGRLFRRVFFCCGPLYDRLFARCRKDEDEDGCLEGVDESDPSSGRREKSSSASSKRHKSSSSAHSRLHCSSNSSAVIGSHDATVEEDGQQLYSVDENSNTSRTGSNSSHVEEEADQRLQRMEEEAPSVNPETVSLPGSGDKGDSLSTHPHVAKSVSIVEPRNPRRRTATEETL